MGKTLWKDLNLTASPYKKMWLTSVILSPWMLLQQNGRWNNRRPSGQLVYRYLLANDKETDLKQRRQELIPVLSSDHHKLAVACPHTHTYTLWEGGQERCFGSQGNLTAFGENLDPVPPLEWWLIHCNSNSKGLHALFWLEGTRSPCGAKTNK